MNVLIWGWSLAAAVRKYAVVDFRKTFEKTAEVTGLSQIWVQIDTTTVPLCSVT